MFSKTQQRVILITATAMLSLNAAAQITLTSGNGYLDQPATVSGMVIKKEGITVVSGILSLQPGEKLIHHQFVDGFGRPIESIAENASPDEKAIVSFSKYDNLGRQSKQYLGYEGSTNTTYTDPATAITDQYNFYNTGTTAKKIAADIAPFSQAEFEASPLQRPLKQGGVGDGFQTNQHYKTIVYRANTGSSSGQDKVRYWNTSGNNSSYYAAGELTVTELTDEAGNKTFIFKDKTGRLILKRQQADDATYGTYFDTYYGYDEMGNLSFIIPPKADIAITSGSSITTVPNLVYQYVYDEYNRVVEKKTPGTTSTGWEYIIYDPLGRVVLTQNGKLRAANQWLFIKYDNLNRPIIQGIYTDATNTTRSAMQTYVNGQSCYATGSTTFYEFESHKSTIGVSGGYSSQCFPIDGRTDHKYINYDNYDFDGTGDEIFTYEPQGLTNETSPTNLLFGIPTVVRRRILGGNRWLREVTFYDKYYHPIQIQSSNQYDPATVTDYTTNVIDFSGKLQTAKTTKNTGSINIDVLNTYTYDYMDRLKQVDQSNNNATAVIVARYEYNPLGQLVDKKLHSTNGTSFLQSVDYRFNIRGQLTTINNSQRTSDAGVTNDETNDLFGMEILYEKQDAAINNNPSGNAVQYSGLITGTKWSTAAAPVTNNNTGERSYVFTYDKLYRLQTAVYKANTTPGAAFTKDVNGYNESMEYDANGNILTLNRKAILPSGGGYALTTIDDLRYFYTTNSEQLSNIDDAVTSTTLPGFRNLMGSSATYSYDENGSLAADPKKGTTLTYNEYNKITAIIKTSANSKVEYVYTADGIRVTKKVYNNSTSPTKIYEYIGGFVFENDNLSYYGMAEGRVRNDGGSTLSLKPEYFITDYQSNTRVSFEDNGSGIAIMRQENSYYAFGMQMPGGYTPAELPNKKLYNAGSEWQDDIDGLADYYSTFFREYDAIIGRFNGVDPMAAASDMLTVYNYANNSPVNFNDPLGDMAMQMNAIDAIKYMAENAKSGMFMYWSNGMLFIDTGDPVENMIDALLTKWGVNRGTIGGTEGFQNVVKRVKSRHGDSSTDQDVNSTSFYDLTAAETVREQVINADKHDENYGPALQTILQAYKDVLNFENGSGWVYKSLWSRGAGGHNSQSVDYGSKVAKTIWEKDFFSDFANKSTARPTSFGLLVRSIYHEYNHMWDFTGIKRHEQIGIYSSTVEFRAHYLMGTNNDGRLPLLSAREKYIYWGEILHYGKRRENLYFILMADKNVSAANKHTYTLWYNQIVNYINSYNK